MRKTVFLFAICVLGISLTGYSQTKSAPPAKVQTDDKPVIKPDPGSSPSQPATKAMTEQQKDELSKQIREESYKKAQLDIKNEKEYATRKRKSFHPNDGSGIIKKDIGIVKQGETVKVYFPANFTTLEPEETVMTPAVSRADFIKYQKLTEGSEITDVQITTQDGKFQKNAFHGFEVRLNPDALGAVDEVVEVFTKQGNLQLRVTGYVVDKDTKLSMK